MNLHLYNRPLSSENLCKNLSLGVISPHSARPLTYRPDTSASVFDKVLLSQRTLRNETQAEDFYKSPEDSQYFIQLHFPERPKTSHLSGLTVLENERISYANKKILKNKQSRKLGNSKTEAIFMPTERDFTKILTKLEMVASNRTAGHKRVNLKDMDSIEVLLEPGETQYFTVLSKNMKPPMGVNLKKTRGKVVCYMSKSNPKPAKGMCDGIFKVEEFQVSDISAKFKIDAIYLAIEAVTESILTLSITFGKVFSVKKASNLKITEEEQEIINRPDKNPRKIEKSAVKLNTINGKDFIQINIADMKPMASPKDLHLKELDWQKRRENVMIRRKMIIVGKKERTLVQINRHRIKREEEKKERILKEELFVLQCLQKQWLCVVFFVRTMVDLRKIRLENRKNTLDKVKKSVSASRIQKMYHRRVGNRPTDIILIRTSNLLHLFASHAKVFSQKKLVKCVKTSSNNHKLPYGFAKFMEKILFIQRKYAEYTVFKQKQWKNLIKHWDNCIESHIMKAALQKGPKKQSHNSTKNYSAITIAARSVILHQYVIEYKKSYLRAFADYRESTKRLTETVVSKLSAAGKGKSLQKPVDFPKFDLTPPREILEKLVEAALKLSI